MQADMPFVQVSGVSRRFVTREGAGLEVAVTLAVVGAIVGEFIQADRGLGYALQQATAVLNTTLGFAVIVILAVIGIVLFAAVEALERWATPWAPARRSELASPTS